MANPVQQTSSPQSSSAPTRLPSDQTLTLDDLKRQKDIAELAQWVKSEYEKARQARSQRQLQWYTNMAYFYGKQWVEQTRSTLPQGYADKLYSPRKPYYQDRKTINRTRSLVRSELSRFLTQTPSIQSVPATAEDQDLRAAYAAEQAWESLRSSGKLETHFSRAVWWMIVTGTGFLKTWWDQDCIDKVSGQPGVIRFGSVSPFNLFVPNLRETEIEDQPFIINAYVKPIQWVKQFFGEQLKGIDIQPSVQSANMLVEEGHLNLSGGNNTPTSCIVYETWIKPGAHAMFPEGGLVVQVDDHIVSMAQKFPYAHGMYPFSKFEHIPTATFYGDSPLVDTNPLQKEYNILRSQISEAGKRMGKPQLLAQKGSITPSKLTNEPGLVIEYKPGFQPPQPMQLSPLPQYLIDQQDRILTDFEDISGQHEVSNGTAPQGVTAGTAINYLQEANDRYFTPQYDSIEQGFENVATQAIELFVQYVDMPRKIKTIGADEAFDTVLLSGSDIASGTDIRVEKGSGVAESKAGKEARVMDMFSVGLIPQEMALKLLEVGGAQKILDVVSVAERKAQRENIKMKLLQPQQIADQQNQIEQEVNMGLVDPSTMQPDPAQPNTVKAPPIIPVDDFDIHAVHIDTHNKFRMGQEYENLSPEVKDQFDRHVKAHEAMLQNQQQGMMMQQLMQAAGGNPDAGQDTGTPDAGQDAVPDAGADAASATMPADAGAPGAGQGA